MRLHATSFTDRLTMDGIGWRYFDDQHERRKDEELVDQRLHAKQIQQI